MFPSAVRAQRRLVRGRSLHCARFTSTSGAGTWSGIARSESAGTLPPGPGAGWTALRAGHSRKASLSRAEEASDVARSEPAGPSLPAPGPAGRHRPGGAQGSSDTLGDATAVAEQRRVLAAAVLGVRGPSGPLPPEAAMKRAGRQAGSLWPPVPRKPARGISSTTVSGRRQTRSSQAWSRREIGTETGGESGAVPTGRSRNEMRCRPS